MAGVSAASEDRPPDPEPARGQTVFDRLKERQDGGAFRPRGLRRGSLVIFPEFASEMEYTDNLYASRFDRREDIVAHAVPKLTVRSDWPRHRLRLGADAELVRHQQHREDDHLNGGLRGDLRLDARHDLTVAVATSHRVGHEDRSSPDSFGGAKPTPVSTTEATAEAIWRPGRPSARLRIERRVLDYQDVPALVGGSVNHDDRDRTLDQVSVRAGWAYRPRTDAFVEAGVRRVRYDVEAGEDDAGEDRDSDGWQVVVGTGLDFSGVTAGEVFVGYLVRERDDPRFERMAGITGGGRLRWNVTPLTTLTAEASRDVRETSWPFSAGYRTTRAAAAVHHEFRRNVTARASLAVTVNRYEGIGRLERQLDVGLGLEYLASRTLGGRLAYEKTVKDNHDPIGEFVRDRVMARITTRF